ncbi:universal stress protein [Caulobacter sp. 602-1]|nr:universal stress protein [Caulobacter sp. 602-1]
MKTVLLLVHADAGQEARLQAALDLTRALEGRLICVDVTPIPDFAGDIGGAAQAMILEEEREAETINRTALEARLAGEGVAWDWIDATGDFTQCLMRQTGLADVIVVNCKRDTMMGADPRGVVASVVSQASCPVVAVPDDARGFNPNLPALVAWDGSEPCMAALRASVPLLRLARSVTLFVVEDGAARVPPVEAAAAYLSRHDIHATIEQVAADGATPDALILTACEAAGVGYCVMGAFGHGRLREELFGGVTRRMLDAAELPLVLGR